MKVYIKKRIALYLMFILALSALQYVLITLSLSQYRELRFTYNEVRTILLIFMLVQVFVVIFLISFLPGYFRKMLNGINSIINDISRGSYNQNIDLDEYHKKYDKEIVEVVESVKKMLTIILKFDSLKKEKIQEQKGRIIALLNLTENGFMIVNQKGDIVYTNHFVKEHFPNMTEDINILEANFGLEIDNNVKKYAVEIIKSQSKARQKQFYMASMKRHITLRSELVRDVDGNFIGAVIGLYNLGKRDLEKGKETEEKQQ